MNMHQQFNRRIRIVGKPGETRGYMLTVYDAETEQAITNVRCVTLYLRVEAENVAEVTYYEANEQGKIRADKWGGPIERTITLANPEVDVTAWEEKGKENEHG